MSTEPDPPSSRDADPAPDRLAGSGPDPLIGFAPDPSVGLARDPLVGFAPDPLVGFADVNAVIDRIDPEDLESLRSLADAAADKPWLAPALAAMREELVLGAEVADRLAQRHLARRRRSRSCVLALRLDADELHALERRAAYLGVGPTVLARNFVRIGLRGNSDPDVGALIDELETTVARLRERLAQPGHRQ